MTLDILQSIVRAVLNALGGTVIAKGYADSSTWEAVTGGAVMLAAVLWSAWHQSTMKTSAQKPLPKPIAPEDAPTK